MLIEIIGLPGSGKSTLIEEVMSNQEFSRQVVTWDEIKYKAIRYYADRNPEQFGSKVNTIMRIVFKIPIVKKQFADFLIYKKLKFSPHTYNEEWSKIINIVVKDISERPLLEDSKKPHYINWEIEKILRTRILKSFSSTTGKKILLDEGIVTALSTLSDVNQEYIYKRDNLPDLAIFIDTKLEDVLSVAKIRRENGEQVELNNRSDIETEDFFERKLCKYRDIVSNLQKIGIPVLIYRRDEDNIDDLIILLNDMIKE